MRLTLCFNPRAERAAVPNQRLKLAVRGPLDGTPPSMECNGTWEPTIGPC